ncbi:MAG: hypothetical protein E7773_14790 [Sphingomonas sp.]|uniref:hypothetical protein n=1 Tax=Sphingomonas sp. TaxID=28214 RepID=UPI00122A146D|nr:hypothetical protein [Sphingomonas sp.]THD34453.1 MAG: hypothetical protein E7773_14790 [Sphingomonas sp.]
MTEDEDIEAGGDAPRIRIGSGPGGPDHMEEVRDEQRELRRSRVEAAIAALETADDRRFPDVHAILEHADGGLSKNRVYDEQDLMYAAQSRWNAREKAAGRPTRKLRGGNRDELKDWVPKVDHDRVCAQLTAALAEIKKLKKSNRRFSKENEGLKEDVRRLELGVIDEIWPPKATGICEDPN